MGSSEHIPVCPLICPALRAKHFKDSLRTYIGGYYFYVVSDTNYFSNAGDDKSSNSRHQLYPLYWCNNQKYSKYEFECGACQCKTIGTTYYFCKECREAYHKECVESLSLIKSSYHPKHHLQLLKYGGYDDTKFSWETCRYCGSACGSYYSKSSFYHCFVCKFSLDQVCARKPPFLNYTKRHEHALNYFPRKSDLICDVCGEVDSKTFIFVCLECDFVVHKNCIYLPFVIKISRHEHRISFTYSSPSKNLSCGVCRQKVDENYGKYSCAKGCTYEVHSRCAIRGDVWDGKELEGEPEAEVYKILNSFEKISDGIIQHFSHSQHNMRFEKGTNMLYDEKKQCQACPFPLYDGNFYKCMYLKCDFALHEVCANLPRMKQHMLYPYPLILKVSNTNKYFHCLFCGRYSCGFRYVHGKWGDKVNVDVLCASISEPFDHPCHIHPLFQTQTGNSKKCSMCGFWKMRPLNCIECDFALCFQCATYPYKVRYEHDEHFLTLSYIENVSLNWCELCEEGIYEQGWRYTCNECGVTLHIKCLLGEDDDIHAKPAQNIRLCGKDVNIVLNNSLTRPFCDWCKKRCKDKTVFETRDGRIFCNHSELWHV